jgi:hypothetical protein
MSTFDQVTVKPNGNQQEDVGFQIDPTNAPYVNVGGEMTGSVMGVHGVALMEVGEIGVYGEGPAGVIGSGSAFTTGEGQAAGVCGVVNQGISHQITGPGVAGYNPDPGVTFGPGEVFLPDIPVYNMGVYGKGNTTSGPQPKGVGVYGIGDLVGVHGRAAGPNAVGVTGIGGGGDASMTPGGVNGEGVGVYGSGGQAEGGVFSSVSGAQMRLVPSSVPIEETSLMQTGQVGDLYLYSTSYQPGDSGTYNYNTILWLCLSPAWQHNDNQAVWAPVQLGDTIGG